MEFIQVKTKAEHGINEILIPIYQVDSYVKSYGNMKFIQEVKDRLKTTDIYFTETQSGYISVIYVNQPKKYPLYKLVYKSIIRSVKTFIRNIKTFKYIFTT